MILLLECQQGITLEPALSGRHIPNKCTMLVPAGLCWWGQGNQPGCAASLHGWPWPCWHTGLERAPKPPHPPNSEELWLYSAFPWLSLPLPLLIPVQTPSPCPRAGRRARMAGRSWTREEAGERVIRSGQHWTRVLGKVPLWKQNECNKLSVWH